MDLSSIRTKVRLLDYDLSSHAHQERQAEKITIKEIEQALLTGDIIESYPEDPRGESCLVSGTNPVKPLHAICGNRGDKLLIVTVYRPKPPTWKDARTRAKELRSRV